MTARQLLQERTLRAVAALADAPVPAADTGEGKAALPTLGQFQRERRPLATRKR